ncbi:MAG: restriction endonuclease subunit S [Candidatus Anstonellales archaeon]
MKSKSALKQTEIGEIPNGWQIATVGDFLELSSGKFNPTRNLSQEHGVPVYGGNGITGFYSEHLVSEPTIVIGRVGAYCGSIHLTKNKAWITDNAIYISRLDNHVDIQFLYYLLQKVNLRKLAETSGQPKITQDPIKQLRIALPPIHEQQKISDVLSTVDDAIQKSDKIIQKTQLLKKSMMHQLLTRGIKHTKFKQTEIGEIPENWDYKKITELFKIETGTTPSTKNSSYWIDGNIEWFTPADMSKLDGKLSIEDSRRKITEIALKETNLSLIPHGSILLSTRAPVGYVAILGKSATFNQGCKGLIPKDENVDITFYAYLLLSKRDFLQSISSGSTFKELSKDSLSSLVLPQPPLSEQQQIASIISEIDKKIELEMTRKEYFEQIKQGLMNDLLTGKKRLN